VLFQAFPLLSGPIRVMDFIGVLSNPVGPLKTVLDGKLPVCPAPLKEEADSASIEARHRRAGWVVEAIVRVLATRGEPMQARAIHGAVEALLGESVCWSSVKASLAANVSGPSPRFKRVGPGRYQLARPL
jgi:HB1, ASXL, restriction endonuclease HTH domain